MHHFIKSSGAPKGTISHRSHEPINKAKQRVSWVELGTIFGYHYGYLDKFTLGVILALRPRPSPGSYLEYHGRCIRVTIRVPAELQKAVGATKLKEALPTDSPKLAERLKWDVIARLRRRIEDARSQKQGSSLEAEALLWRTTIPSSPQSEQEALEIAAVTYPLEERAEEIEETHGEAKAQQFFAIATGIATLIDTHIESWLEESRYAGRTKAAYTLSIRRFREWLSSKDLPTTIEAVTRRLAGDYKVHLERTGMHHNTANKDLSGLSLYWAWLDQRGHVRINNNPWRGVRVEAYRQTPRPEDGGGDKRAFKDNEIKVIMNGLAKSSPNGAGAALPDLCVIAALTGARISEIIELRVRHCDLDKMELFIPGTKTDNASRRIPLHSGLKHIMQRRIKDKTPDDCVFHEVPEQQSEARGRAAPASQAFTRIRRRLGVDDQLAGARQSRIDFHSFRRWFVSKATAALDQGAPGFNHWTIADVVGHSKDDMPLSMTMGVYAGRASMEAMRACVEAVKLPT